MQNLKVLLIFTLFLVAFPTENRFYFSQHINGERPSTAGIQGPFFVDYLMYVYVTIPVTYNVTISWEYWTSNLLANISVLIMDTTNFSLFQWHYPNNCESASNGSNYPHANGIWYNNSTKSNYNLVVVYWNNGSNHESTLLTTNTTFRFNPTGLLYYGVTQFYHGTGTRQTFLNDLGGFFIVDLYPNDWIYEYYPMTKNDNISWRFSSANLNLTDSNVTISVSAMDADNYALMVEGDSYQYYPLVERSHSFNGTFYPPSNGTWYILFANNDPVGQPVVLLFNIKINRQPTPIIPDSSLVMIIIILLCIALLIIVGYILHRRGIKRKTDANQLTKEQSQMMALLDKIEHYLRDLINTIMSRTLGNNWSDRSLRPEDIAEMRSRWEARKKENPAHRIIDELTFNHYKQIMTGSKGAGAKRKQLFVDAFGLNYDWLIATIGPVAEIRNCADHRNWNLIFWQRDLPLLEAFSATLSKIFDRIK